MLPDGLGDAERPAEALAHEALGRSGRFSIGQRAVFAHDSPLVLQQLHGQVSIFGDRVSVVTSSLLHSFHAPCANGSRNHADRAQHVEGTAFEILAGDVFQRLPASPEVHAVTDFSVAGYRADFGISKMRHQ